MKLETWAILLVLLPAAVPAQRGVTGTWRADPSVPLTIVLKADGPKPTGAVDRCSNVQQVPSEIVDARVEGDRITFKCISPDGDRIVSFTGRITGDSAEFTYVLNVRDGGRPPELFDPFMSLPGRRVQNPARFTATRAADTVGEGILARLAARVRAVVNSGSITFDRVLKADQEPQHWLTYSGNVYGHRHSVLTELTPANVKDLELAWLWQQPRSAGKFEATPLVVDDVLYTVQAPNDVVALDATTGRFLWTYRYVPAPEGRVSGGGGRVNRGLAILGDTLFMGTIDARLIAIDAKTGALVWNTTVADAADPLCQIPDRWSYCYSISHAPLVVKDKVIVGVGGGDGDTPGRGIRGFLAAFDAKTGKEVWRFHTIPAPGEPGNDTWSGDSWKTGGAGIWLTGSYDPELNLTYWGTGNPIPANGATRRGDNLYSDSVIALDADTGKLRWHYQFMPHDEVDWDSAQIPVLIDGEWQGRPRKLMVWSNRNGVMYVFDRTSGEFLRGRPFVEVNWLERFDQNGRPVFVPGKLKAPDRTAPGTNWQSPSYSPRTGLVYVSAQERKAPGPGNGAGAVRAFDPKTGDMKWEFKRSDTWFFSILTTASDLLFSGVWGDPGSGAAANRENGYFYALDARTGQQLWRTSLAGSVYGGGPITYRAGGKQYVAVTAGNVLFAFALRHVSQ